MPRQYPADVGDLFATIITGEEIVLRRPTGGNALRYYLDANASPSVRLFDGGLEIIEPTTNTVRSQLRTAFLQFNSAAGAQRILVDADTINLQMFNAAAVQQALLDTDGLRLGPGTRRARLHVVPNSLSLQAAALAATTGAVLEDNDAILELVSNAGGNWGSGIGLAEIDGAGALVSKWGLIRRTAGGGNDLRFTYGADREPDVNPAQLQLSSGGILTVNGGQVLSGLAAATSLIVGGQVTGAAPAQRDMVLQTGNAANPQVLVTRMTLPSNIAQGAGVVNINESLAVLSGSNPAQSGAIRLPNNQSISARNGANNAEWALISLAPTDAVSISQNGTQTTIGAGVSVGAVAPGNPASAGIIRLPNAQWIAGRNFANGADINLFQVNVSDEAALGANVRLNTGVLLSGLAAATSLTVGGQVTGGAPAQRDIAFQTGNAANPQVAVTRMALRSNAAQGSSLIDFFEAIAVLAGSSPATTGAIRLPNNQSISARNGADNADWALISFAPTDTVSISQNGTQTQIGAGVSVGAVGPGNPASAGLIRIPNAQWIAARNAANNADVNMWQVNATNQIASGAAPVLLNQQLYPASDALATQTACAIFAGTGVPNNANGANGDIYFRSDGGALTTVYQRRAGAWVGIV